MSCASRVVLSLLLVGIPLTDVPTAAAGAPAHSTGAPRLSLEVLPPIAQLGPLPASADAADTVLTARLHPSGARRPVRLERRSHGDWLLVALATTSADGTVSFTADRVRRGRGVTYRVTAPAQRGLRRRIRLAAEPLFDRLRCPEPGGDACSATDDGQAARRPTECKGITATA